MKALFVLVMCTVAGTASARGASNAFDAWKLPPSVNQDTLDRALELSRNLEVGRQVPRAELEAALESREALDALVTVMREGLAAKTCTLREEDNPIGVLTLAHAALSRALVALHEGQDATPRVTEVVSLGRKVARCGKGAVVNFGVGLRIEQVALTLLEWGAERSLWSKAAQAHLKRALETRPLGTADLQRAVDNELQRFLSLMPPGIGDEHAYSRKATEAQAREELARLKRSMTAKDSDAVAHEESLRALVTMEELELMKPLLYGDDENALNGKLSGFAPNMVGRFFLSSALSPVPQALKQLRDDLPEAEARRKRLAKSTLEAPKPWLEAPSRTTASARPGGDATVSESLGRCERVEPGRYRLDAASQAMFESDTYFIALTSAGRLVPSSKDGVVQGFKVFGFSDDSFYGSCGFQVDDVVVRINGVEALDPVAMVPAVERVAQARRAEIDLLRAGNPVRLIIEGRPAH
jgi:hypothetical protein